MRDLETLRGGIDSIDRELVALFEQRMKLCREVAEYKKENRLPIFQAGREEAVLRTRVELLEDSSLAPYIKEIFSYFMSVSKREQFRIYHDFDLKSLTNTELCDTQLKDRPAVAYFGTEGSYSDRAAELFFEGRYQKKEACQRFDGVFEAIESAAFDYGVVPVENSSTGGIGDVVDLLVRHNCSIVGETVLKIEHCLLGLPGSDLSQIKTVYSHEQGLLQCSTYLQSLPGVQTEVFFNTAKSARHVRDKNDPAVACIAGKQAASLYGLQILKEDIGNNEYNQTRFIVIAKRPVVCRESNKISVVFKIAHESGSLYHILSNFANNGLNLVKIESRPIPVSGSTFEYLFYVDIIGNLEDEAVKSALSCVMEAAAYFKFLGNYPAAN